MGATPHADACTLKQVPSEDSIRAFLGADLYAAYEQEEHDGSFYGTVSVQCVQCSGCRVQG